jgi:hypothetical protein
LTSRQKAILGTAGGLLVAAGVVFAARIGPLQRKPPIVDRGSFHVIYDPSASYPLLRKALKERGTMEKLLGAFNAKYALPYPIEVRYMDCGKDYGRTAYHTRESGKIELCYDLVAKLGELFIQQKDDYDTAGVSMMGGLKFAFLHEFGHALTDAWGGPVTRQEREIQGDQVATIILFDLGADHVQDAIDGASFFYLLQEHPDPDQDQGPTPKDPTYFDEHLLGKQRAFQILCLIYGSNPERYLDKMPKWAQKDLRNRREECEENARGAGVKWADELRAHRLDSKTVERPVPLAVAGPDEEPEDSTAYVQSIYEVVRSHWRWPAPLTEGTYKTPLNAGVRVPISADGLLGKPEILSKSNDGHFDNSCLAALQETVTVAPPPVSLRTQFARGFVMQFYGNVVRAEASSRGRAKPPSRLKEARER